MSTTAIINAHVIPISRESFHGTVVLTDGKIAALGANLDLNQDVTIVDAQGAWLTPGLVEPHGHTGIWEEGKGWAGDDVNEAVETNSASLRAIDGIHPTDEGFQDALSGGVTTIVVKPGSAGPIGGQTVAIKTWGRIVDEMVIKNPCTMKAALGENPKRYFGINQKKAPCTRMGVAYAIRKALVDAINYQQAAKHAETTGQPFARNLEAEALGLVLDRSIPWSQHVHRVDDIATAIRLADEFGYQLVIEHGTEAHLIADFIAEKKIPVVMGPLLTSRSKLEVTNRHLRNPGILDRAGVEIALTTDSPVVPINFLIHQAQLCVKEGLAPTTAMKAITLNPAKFMGIDDRVGSIEVGKDADLVLWSQQPLQQESRAMIVFVNGKQVYHYDDKTGSGVTVDPYVALARKIDN